MCQNSLVASTKLTPFMLFVAVLLGTVQTFKQKNIFLSFNVLLWYQRLVHIKKRWSALLQCQLHSALQFVTPNDESLVCVVCWWVQTSASMEPGASLAMHVSTLSKLITWPTRHNASFAASIALMRSRRVFLVLVRLSMCEGKRMPWSHTCVSVSFTKCRTCRCLTGAQHLSSSTSRGWVVDFVMDVDQPQQLQANTLTANLQVLSGSYSERGEDQIS
jgi:hypothetical protein